MTKARPGLVRFIMWRVVESFPFACGLFCLHTLFDGWVYWAWATSRDGERDLLWVLTFVVDRPLLFVYQIIRPETGLATLLMFASIGGVAWALLGALVEVTVVRCLRRKNAQ